MNSISWGDTVSTGDILDGVTRECVCVCVVKKFGCSISTMICVISEGLCSFGDLYWQFSNSVK